MARKKRFELLYDARVKDHVAGIDRKHHLLIRQTLEEMLAHSPEKRTRNRKPLLRPSRLGPAWELRFGPRNRFRAFYRVDAEAHEVHVLAIGVKEGNCLFIGKEAFEL